MTSAIVSSVTSASASGRGDVYGSNAAFHIRPDQLGDGPAYEIAGSATVPAVVAAVIAAARARKERRSTRRSSDGAVGWPVTTLARRC